MRNKERKKDSEREREKFSATVKLGRRGPYVLSIVCPCKPPSLNGVSGSVVSTSLPFGNLKKRKAWRRH